jgi:hypothetical protein
MRPGDVVRCSACGTEATAYTTGDPARWREGEALLVSWGGYSHEAVLAAPDRCAFCLARAPRGRPAPTRRVAIMDELALAGCRTDGFEWNTDALVEDAFQRWIAAGRPPLALVSVGRGPCVDGVQHADPGTTRPGTTVGFKAPAERSPAKPQQQLSLL